MAIEHAAPGDLIDVRPLGRRLRETDSRTLIRTTHLEVFRYALPAGKSDAATMAAICGCVVDGGHTSAAYVPLAVVT